MHDNSNSYNWDQRSLKTVTNIILLYNYFFRKTYSEDDDVTCYDAAASHDGTAHDGRSANDDATTYVATTTAAPNYYQQQR